MAGRDRLGVEVGSTSLGFWLLFFAVNNPPSSSLASLRLSLSLDDDLSHSRLMPTHIQKDLLMRLINR
jgi:hypothetical protein